MDDLVKQLKVALATVFTTYLKAHNFHWNVTGPNFAQYHDFFSDYYTELHSSVDLYAEHIRTLDAYAPGSLSRFSELSMVEDETAVLSAEAMLQALYADNETIRSVLNVARDAAEAGKHYGIVNFLEDRLDYHAKMHWMLRSFLVKITPQV